MLWTTQPHTTLPKTPEKFSEIWIQGTSVWSKGTKLWQPQIYQAQANVPEARLTLGNAATVLKKPTGGFPLWAPQLPRT